MTNPAPEGLYGTLEAIHTLTLPDADLGYIGHEHAPLENMLHDYECYIRIVGPFAQADRLRLAAQADTFKAHAEALALRCGLDLEAISDAQAKGLIPLIAEFEEGEPPVDPAKYVLYTFEENAVHDLLWLSANLRAQGEHSN